MSAPTPWSAFARRYARRVSMLLQGGRARSGDTAPGSPGTPGSSGHDAGERSVAFRCNLCGLANRVAPALIGREIRSCAGCGSTVRFRAIGRLVARELLGRDAALADLAPDRRIRGLGLSDSGTYAAALADKFAYENTFYHASPRFDILSPPAERRGRYDFLIASDVFEHVAPPVARAFENARALLAPRGVFIFTVPYVHGAQTLEHFPDLHEWRVDESDGRFRVVNTTRDGRLQTFDDPVFHGGIGATLEMRVFALDALMRDFAAAGFARTRVADEPCAAFGIAWPEPLGVPIVAYAQ